MQIYMAIMGRSRLLEKHSTKVKSTEAKSRLFLSVAFNWSQKAEKLQLNIITTPRLISYPQPNNLWRNLQTDYLDLLLLHRPSPLMQADEIAEAVETLKHDGKILDFGVSNFTPSQTDLIQTKTKINYNQIRFSVTHFGAMLDGSLDHMQTHNITPMSWSPLGSVFKNDDEQAKRVKQLATKFAIKYDVPLEVLLLAWILKHPSNILPVCGTTDLSRIANLMKATTIELDLQDWFALWTESAGVPVP
jgi:predicted oxidoreductase